MPSFSGVLGPQRTLVIAGTTRGTVEILRQEEDLTPTFVTYWRSAEYVVRAWMGDVEAHGMLSFDGTYLTIFKVNDPTCPFAVEDATHVFVQIRIRNAFTGAYTTVNGPLHSCNADGQDTIIDMAGTVSISCPCEELFEVSDLPAFMVDTRNFPKFGGDPQEGNLEGHDCRFSERARVGQTYILSATVGDCVASVSAAAGAALPVSYDVDIECFCRCYGGGYFSGLAGFTLDFLAAVFPGSYFRSLGEGEASAQAQAVGNDCQCTTGSGGSDPDDLQSRIAMRVAPPTIYRLNARLRAMEHPYPGSVTAIWSYKDGVPKPVALDPGHIETSIQYAYLVFAVLLDEIQDSAFADERIPQTLHLTGLEALGEDKRDWRCQILGRRFQALNLTNVTPLVVDAGSSLTGWSNVANVTLSVVGGAISMAVAGGVGSCQKAIDISHEGHRYLQVRARCTTAGSQAIRITYGSKQWDVVTDASAGTWTVFTLDLCCATNASAAYDEQDSRYPLDMAGGLPQNEGPLWGVNHPATIIFSQLADTQTYEVDYVQLARLEWCRTTWLSPMLEWLEAYPPGAKEVFYLLHALADTDGRVSLEPIGITKEIAGVEIRYFYTTITELIAFVNGFEGWTATAPAYPDAYHDGDYFALSCGGGGATVVTNAAGEETWTDQLDVDTSAAPTAIYAQSLFDRVEAYPVCGNVWDPARTLPTALSTTDAKACPIRVNKVLRGQAHGLAFTTAQVPFVGGHIACYPAGQPLALVGDALTGARGEFQTALPYGKGNQTFVTELKEPAISRSELWLNRRRSRTSFRGLGVTGDGNPFVRWDPLSTRLMKSSIRSGSILFRRAPGSIPSPGWEIEVTPVATTTWKDPRFTIDHRGVIILVARRENPPGTYNVYELRSTDDGNTWSAPVLAFSSGHRPDIEHYDGHLVEAAFKYNSGTSGPGRIYTRYWGPGDTTWSGETAIVDQAGAAITVADDSFNITPCDDSPQRWILTCLIDGESSTSEWQAWDQRCTAFKRIT